MWLLELAYGVVVFFGEVLDGVRTWRNGSLGEKIQVALIYLLPVFVVLFVVGYFYAINKGWIQ